MSEIEEEEIKFEKEEKEERRSWWETLPPIYLIGGAILLFLAMRSIMVSERKDQYLLLVIGVIVILYVLSKNDWNEGIILPPKDAEILVRKELRRKIEWGQWPLGTKFFVSPINNIIHRDARGMYYEIGATVQPPFTNKQEYYSAKVMMRGPEKGFVSFIKNVGPVTGRDMPQEKTILPQWLKLARDDETIERLFGKFGKF